MSEGHHFLISPTNISGNQFWLNGSEGFHLSHVLRLGVGDEIFLLNSHGNAHRALIEKIESGVVSGTIRQTITEYHESRTRLHLGFGILKGSKLDLVAQKATELGARSLTPLIMKHNVRPGINRARLDRIASSAAKQCGRGHIPVISEPVPFDEWCANVASGCSAATDNSDTSIPIWEWLSGCPNNTGNVWLTVGPEGGYHEEEIALISESGIPSVSMGPRQLRSETAAISALAICDSFFSARTVQ